MTPVPTNDIVLILDDAGDQFLSWAKHARKDPAFVAVTPFLSGLAAQSMVWHGLYTMPACSTTRASFWTCSLPRRTGVGAVIKPTDDYELDDSIPTWFGRLRDAGVATYLVGKHHLSATANAETHPIRIGATEYRGTLHNVPSYDMYDWTHATTETTPETTPEFLYHTSMIENQCATVLYANESGEHPFVLVIATQAPHEPFHAVPDNLCVTPDDGTEIAKYLRAIEAVDSMAASIWASMTATQRATTRWWVLSDNGPPKSVSGADPGSGKGTTGEDGVNGTLFIYNPASIAHIESNWPVSICDVGQGILYEQGVAALQGVYGSQFPRGVAAVQKFDTHGQPDAGDYIAGAIHIGGWKLRMKKKADGTLIEDWYTVDIDHSVETTTAEANVPVDIRDALRAECWLSI